jgi:(p)ppGpp synthase/HD superfamily hydrolase
VDEGSRVDETSPDFVVLAEQIARQAHSGQKDKAGADYIEHPRRVAERFDPVTQPDEYATAWLHDVIEDTPISPEYLRASGIPQNVVEAVQLLTKDDREMDLDQYYARILTNPLALAVKAADIADNTDPARTALLEPDVRHRLAEKYTKARRVLGLAP